MPNPTRSPSFCLIAALSLIAVTGETRAADDPLTIEVTAETGLKFDPPRFVVPPGARVKIVLTNPDSMSHNLVVTAPGEREAIVNAALALGADASTGFVPKSDKVLAAIGIVEPNDAGSVEFTTPEVEGVYPYVCTYPGHGFVMYGAMYVSKDAKLKLPAIKDDANVSPLFKATEPPDAALVEGGVERRRVQRTFLRDCGPAAIAVSMGDGTSYAFDAGACRLRYIWSGGFIDNRPYLKANGNDFAQVVGRIWYRDAGMFPLRIGYDDDEPDVEFLGYRLVEGLPEFRYRVRGDEVRERITPAAKGDNSGGGVVRTFAVKSDRPVRFVVDPDGGAAFTSDVGEFKAGELALTSEQARRFAVTMTRRAGVEPIWYGSMNDVLGIKNVGLSSDGLIGRAAKLYGKEAQIDTGVKPTELAMTKGGGAIAMWVRVDGKSKDPLPLLAVGEATLVESTELGEADGKTWRFVLVTIEGDKVAVSVDGGEPTKRAMAGAAAADATLVIGSDGERFFKGEVDEVRVYARPLSDAEIAKLHAEGNDK